RALPSARRYSLISVNVGLVGRSIAPQPRARPRVSAVLPAPRLPERQSTSPGWRRRPSRSPSASVSSGECVVIVRVGVVSIVVITPQIVSQTASLWPVKDQTNFLSAVDAGFSPRYTRCTHGNERLPTDSPVY